MEGETINEDCIDSWICCDRCGKWRRVPKEMADGLEDDAEWYCEFNPNPLFASCNVPQELTNEEIDQEEAGEADAARLNLPKLPAIWQLIRGNAYSHRKRKQQDEDDIMVCHCPPPWRGGDGCGPNCINRMLCIECTEDFCPCENSCNNQMFTRKQYAKLSVRRAGPKGFGLYADEDVPAGQFLIEYIGEVLEEEEYMRRKQYYIQTGQRHYYFMNIGNGEVIDACRKGNHARFINHSCEPNCETQKWMVQGELAIGLFTLRKIKAGEELTFDYNFERYGDKPMRCFCGSKKCRKFIGGTQESTADIVGLGDAEDVTNDPEPVMVREEETDAMVQAMLDKEVGTIKRSWDSQLLNRLQELCQQKGIDWSLAVLPEASLDDRTASTQQQAGQAGVCSQDEQSEDLSRAAAAVSHAATAPSPASSSAPASEAAAARSVDGVDSPLAVRGPLKAALKNKRKRAQQQEEEQREAAAAAAVAAAAQKQLQEERMQRKQQLQEQREKKRLKQQEQFIRRQLQEEKRLQRLQQERLKRQQEEQIRQQRQEQEGADDDVVQDEQEQEEAASLSADDEELDEQEMSSGQDELGQQVQGHGEGPVRVTDADLEDDLSSDEELQVQAKLAAPPVPQRRQRVRVTQSRRRPPLAPARAADNTAGKQQKGTTGSAPVKRSFLTLAVSTVGKQLKRRSEVDRRLEQLVQKQSFKLREPGQQSVIKVLRMFNLCDIAPRQPDPLLQLQLQQQQQKAASAATGSQQEQQQQQQQLSDAAGSVVLQHESKQEASEHETGDAVAAAGGAEGAVFGDDSLPQLPAHLLPLQPLRGAELEARERESEARFKARQRARMADMGMLLDVVLASSSEKLKKEWVTCGILTQLQQTLGRIPFTQEYSVVLVKVIRVLEHLPITPDDLYTARSAHGTFADLIRRMASSASDWEVRRRSHQLLKRYAASACSDDTLLQLYHVPGPNSKPYLLSLHLPPNQISRLMALLPKNAPPASRHGSRGDRERRQQQQQQQRGSSGMGNVGGFPSGPPAAGPSPMEQHSSPSTSFGAAGAAGLAAEGHAAALREGGPGQWRPQQGLQGPTSAAGAGEQQGMQGSWPPPRGGSASQLAHDGWEGGFGGPPPWAVGGPGSGPPPAHLLPPAGARGMLRPGRYSRHMSRGAGGPLVFGPRGPEGGGGIPPPLGHRGLPPLHYEMRMGGPDIRDSRTMERGPPDSSRGPDKDRGLDRGLDRLDRGSGPPHNSSWQHHGHGWGPYNDHGGPFTERGPPPVGYGGPGGSEPGYSHDRRRERDWNGLGARDWEQRSRDWDRDRDWEWDREPRPYHPDYDSLGAGPGLGSWDSRDGFDDSRDLEGTAAAGWDGGSRGEGPATSAPAEPKLLAGRRRQRPWDSEDAARQSPTGEGHQPLHMQQQQQRGMPGGSAGHGGRLTGSASGPQLTGPGSPGEDASLPSSSSRGWQLREVQPGPFSSSRSRRDGWEALHTEQQQQLQHGEQHAGRSAEWHLQQGHSKQGSVLHPVLGSVEDLCSLGLYAYHQLANNTMVPSPSFWLCPASPQAAEAAVGNGCLSPIISGRFSPALEKGEGAAANSSNSPPATVLPANHLLAVEDLFCVMQDAIMAVRTPGVSLTAVVSQQQATTAADSKHQAAVAAAGGSGGSCAAALQGQQQQHRSNNGSDLTAAGMNGDAVLQTLQQQQQWRLSELRHQQAAAGSGDLLPSARCPPPPDSIVQQQPQPLEGWEQPGPDFEAFVCDAVKRRLGKYVQPDHPNRISKEDAVCLYRKLRREVVEKEQTAYAERQAAAQHKPIERAKLEHSIKEFVRLSIRRLHASRSGDVVAALGPGLGPGPAALGHGPIGMMVG